MQKIILTLVGLLFINSFLFSQCPEIPPNYHRNVNKPVYKWYWDENLNGAQFRGPNYTDIPSDEAKRIVKNTIKSCISGWLYAINSGGVIMDEISEAPNRNSADLEFEFIPMSGQKGFTIGNSKIQLNSSIDFYWTNSYSVAEAEQAHDLETIILHELGHVFLGGGHVEDNSSIMRDPIYGVQRGINNCDKWMVRQFYKLYDITIDNNFTDNSGNATHGKVNIENYGNNLEAPYLLKRSNGHQVSVTAVSNQTSSQNYKMIWNNSEAPLNKSEWRKKAIGENILKSYNKTYNFTVSQEDDNVKYQAQLRKICNIKFKSNLVGVNYTAPVKVNNTNYSTPTANFEVVEQNKINAIPKYQVTHNAIIYTYNKWSDGVSGSRTVYPTEHKTYTANYIGRPSTYEIHQRFNLSDPDGSPIKVIWDQHPNTYVTKYEIWRKVGFHITAPTQKIATINRSNASTYTYTDNIYKLKHSGEKDEEISYCVKCYYSLENTWSLDHYKIIYTDDFLRKENEEEKTTNNNKQLIAKAEEIIDENKIENYPNPFNPETIIRYQIKDAGNVKLTVYDALGKVVKVLVNEEKSSGRYEARFDGSKLSSGIYFYTIQAKDFYQAKKMLLTK